MSNQVFKEQLTNLQVIDFDWEDDIELVGKKILVRKTERDDVRNDDGDVVVHLPESIKSKTNWVRIKLVGTDCEEFTQDNVGDYLYVARWAHGQNQVDAIDDYWIIEESVVGDRDKNTVVRPYTLEG